MVIIGNVIHDHSTFIKETTFMYKHELTHVNIIHSSTHPREQHSHTAVHIHVFTHSSTHPLIHTQQALT